MRNKNSNLSFIKSVFTLPLVCLAFLLLCSNTYAQKEIEFRVGGPYLLDRPEAVDQQSGLQLGFTFKKENALTPKLALEPGLGYSTSSFFIDGHFVRTNSGTTFQKIPGNYQQNRLQLTAINMPLLFKYRLFSNSRGEGISIGAGSYLSYLVDVKQCYKLDGVNYSEKVKDIHRLQTHFMFDLGTSGNVVKGRAFAFGAGLQYQLSEHLDNSNSFKPLVPYLRFGFRF